MNPALRALPGLVVYSLLSCDLSAAEFPSVTYELRQGSRIVDDCLLCGRPPIEEPLVGTFVLTRLLVRVPGELYSVTDAQFRCPLRVPGGNYIVKGSGTYYRPTSAVQEMNLDLDVSGVSGVALANTASEVSAEWPAVDVEITEPGDRDPAHRYTIRIAAAPQAKPVSYELVPGNTADFSGSFFIDDCKICGRPTIPLPIAGTFLLGQISDSANPVITYRVDNVAFKSLREGFDYQITGLGTYDQGGEVALLQQMDLLLAVNTDSGVQMSSGRVPFPDGVSFPEIDIQLEHQNPTSQVHVYSLHIVARPSKPGEPHFRRGDSNGDGSVDISDAVFLLLWRFSGGATPGCLDAADSNDDAKHDLSDAVFLLLHLFQGGPAPPFPGLKTCGHALQPSFGCESYSRC